MCTCFQASGWPAPQAAAVAPGPSFARALSERAGLATGSVPQRSDFSFSGLTIVNPGVGRVADATIQVRGDRIVGLDARDAPGDAEFADCFAMPGLIDMHVHALPPLRDFFGRLQLLHGVTSVRNTGDGLDVFSYREQVELGTRQGPRIFACGPPLDGKPTAFPVGTAALEDPDRARAFVSKLAERGADFVKVFINLTPPVLAAIRDEATRRGLRVAGHVPRFNSIEDAGVVDIQHLTGVPMHPSTAFSLDGAFKPWVDSWLRQDARRREQVAASSLDHGIAHTPTLVLWKGLARAKAGSQIARPKGLSLMPAPYVESFWASSVPPTPYSRGLEPGLFEAIERALPEMLRLVGELDEAGVPLLAGTDTINPWVVPGASLHEEIELLQEAGMSAERALVCATRDAALALGHEELGQIQEGGLADFIILRNDPTLDLAHLDTILAVIAGGRLYRVDELRKEHEGARAALSSLPFRIASPILGRLASFALSALPASVPRYPEA